MNKKNDMWMGKAIRHPGRVRRYVMREIGKSGFTERGTIKADALVEAKKIARKHHDVSMEDAITLAQRLRKFKRRR